MTIIYANLDTNPDDLRAAANAQGLTTTQFIAATVNSAVQDWKRKETARLEFIAALEAAQYAISERG